MTTAYIKKVCVPVKTLISWKSGCTLDTTHCTSMATGHNRFPVLAELNSSLPYKIAATVSPSERYPELPALSNYRLLYSTIVICDNWKCLMQNLMYQCTKICWNDRVKTHTEDVYSICSLLHTVKSGIRQLAVYRIQVNPQSLLFIWH
jgi:hypothetical protein